MDKYSEKDIQIALKAVDEGAKIQTTAKRLKIPVSTLRGRISGKKSKKARAEDMQALPVACENKLVAWILEQDECGNSPTHKQIREKAGGFAALLGMKKTFGISWMTRFLKRHSAKLKNMRSRRVDSQRLNAATPDSTEPPQAQLEEIHLDDTAEDDEGIQFPVDHGRKASRKFIMAVFGLLSLEVRSSTTRQMQRHI